METYALPEMVLTGMKIMRGRIIKITAEGEIWVENDPEGLSIPCDFLRTSSAPLPEMIPGDLVLYAIDETGTRGYVLGVIEKYRAEEQVATNGKLASPEANQEFREIKLKAEEKIELSCGKSSLSMNKDGKIIIKGSNLVSRSSGPNRIKGASVAIN